MHLPIACPLPAVIVSVLEGRHWPHSFCLSALTQYFIHRENSADSYKAISVISEKQFTRSILKHMIQLFKDIFLHKQYFFFVPLGFQIWFLIPSLKLPAYRCVRSLHGPLRFLIAQMSCFCKKQSSSCPVLYSFDPPLAKAVMVS